MMTSPSTPLVRLSRRRLVRRMVGVGAVAMLTQVSAACARVVEVERVVKVEKEVTKIVTEIVKQTVVVERTLVAPQPTPVPTLSRPAARLSIQAIRTPWTLYFQRMTPAFEELFDVTLRWLPLSGWAGYAKVVASQQAAGTPPDLIEAPAGVMPLRWQRMGLIQTMTSLVESGAVLTEGILAPALAALQPREQLLGLPFLVHGGDHLLGYHRQLLTSLQLPLPDSSWVLSQLQDLEVARADAGSAPIGFSTSAALPAAFPLVRLFGIRLFDSQGRLATTGDQLAELLVWIKSLAQGAPKALAANPLFSPLGSLEDGRLLATCVSLAQIVNWQWQRSQQEAQESWFAATLFPRRQGQTARAVSINAMGYCLAATTTEYAAAAQWLKYVSGREMGVQLFLQGLSEPGCRAASWTDPRVMDVMPICASVADDLQHAPPPDLPASLDIESCMGIWNRHVRRILDDVAPLEDELRLMVDALAKAADPVLTPSG